MDDPGRDAQETQDANSIASLSNLHVKSLADLARLSTQLPIRWPELPQVPFFGPLLGFNDEWYRAAIGLSVLETRWRGNRALDADEVQIVASQTAKAVATMAYEVPALFATTWLYERRGRATFRFPFYQPGANFNPDIFPSARWTAVRGAAARSLWHLTRVALYTSLSHVALRSLFISYAMAVKNVEFEREPRLANLRAAIRQHAAALHTAHEQQANHHGSPGLPLPSSDGDDKTASTPRRDDHIYHTQAQAQAEAQEAKAQAQAPRQASPPAAPPTDFPADDDDFDGLDAYETRAAPVDDDDNSPVAPSHRARRGWQRGGAQDAGDSGLSAWDRVRTQAASGDARPVPAPSTHPWSKHPVASRPAAEAAEDKPTERELEQRQFDALVDRERHGEDGDDKRRR